jgi:hypothetical protein
MAASSAGTESPGTKPTTILTCFLLSLFGAGFVVQASLQLLSELPGLNPNFRFTGNQLIS